MGLNIVHLAIRSIKNAKKCLLLFSDIARQFIANVKHRYVSDWVRYLLNKVKYFFQVHWRFDTTFDTHFCSPASIYAHSSAGLLMKSYDGVHLVRVRKEHSHLQMTCNVLATSCRNLKYRSSYSSLIFVSWLYYAILRSTRTTASWCRWKYNRESRSRIRIKLAFFSAVCNSLRRGTHVGIEAGLRGIIRSILPIPRTAEYTESHNMEKGRTRNSAFACIARSHLYYSYSSVIMQISYMRVTYEIIDVTR